MRLGSEASIEELLHKLDSIYGNAANRVDILKELYGAELSFGLTSGGKVNECGFLSSNSSFCLKYSFIDLSKSCGVSVFGFIPIALIACNNLISSASIISAVGLVRGYMIVFSNGLI
jgi:hypothetical protein